MDLTCGVITHVVSEDALWLGGHIHSENWCEARSSSLVLVTSVCLIFYPAALMGFD